MVADSGPVTEDHECRDWAAALWAVYAQSTYLIGLFSR